ncbi:sex peptide receptor-like [Amphibalanus amphitrite]|uniref:sex peptide receptor-like n=1 Tax=Amphibalanus amphitrite TaxID=1232801 RepID=UPI001C91CE87|nr:sex peptide receptor-like [Amphibalanus amphitrite]
MEVNQSVLREAFKDYTCRDGDVVFERGNGSLICWDMNASAALRVPPPRALNVSDYTPLAYALPLYGYVMPFLLVVTIIANTLIVVVMNRRHMRTPTNLVLMSMAISDMLTLLLPAPWLLYLYTFGNYNRPMDSVYACYAYVTLTETLPSLFHTSSIWLTLALAVQRYIYVCHAAVARTWCTGPRVLKAVVWIYVLSLLHQSTRFFDRSFVLEEIWFEGEVTYSCRTEIPRWITHGISQDYYFGFYFGFRVLFVHMLPCISLVVFNILLFRTLQEAQAKREMLFRDSTNKGKRECKRAMDSNCTTMMLIVVVSVFLIVEIPLAVVTCLHILENLIENAKILDYDVSKALVVIINFIISLSYPINFAIYCGMSRQFRETFRDLFIAGKTTQFSLTGSSRFSTVNGPRTRTETVL